MNAIEAASSTFLDKFEDVAFLYEEELEVSFQ